MSVASEIARLQNAKASIKTAIENKGVTVGDIKLDAYSAKIDEISTGVEPTGTLEITENGTYDVKQKAYAEVAVPEPSGNIKITENGFHIIKQYSIAEVAVYPTLIAKTISTNGTYNASDDNAYGYGSVSVNVPEKQLGTKTINANGDYNATDDSLDGYSNVSVSVPEKTLTTKTITANGTYNATDDNVDGYSQVTVETSGVDINEYFSNIVISRGANNSNWYSSVLKMPPLKVGGDAPTNGSGIFSYCTLEEIPKVDTSEVTYASQMFYFAKAKIIPEINASKFTDITSILMNCTNLEDFGGFLNLGKAYPDTSIQESLALGLQNNNKMTHDSLMNVINKLYDISNKGTQIINLGGTNKAKLTAEEIAIATNKGWTVN